MFYKILLAIVFKLNFMKLLFSFLVILVSLLVRILLLFNDCNNNDYFVYIIIVCV